MDAGLVTLSLELGAELALKRLYVLWRWLVARLTGVEHEAALLIKCPLAAYAIAEGNCSTDGKARPHDSINFDSDIASDRGARLIGKIFRGEVVRITRMGRVWISGMFRQCGIRRGLACRCL